MGKKEFLRKLQEHLDGQMQQNKIQAHVRYYKEYIEMQIKNGKREEAVLAELGEPYLIARTLLDTDNNFNVGEELYERCCDSEQDYGREDLYENYGKSRIFRLDLTSWYGKVLVLAVVILAVLGLLVIIGTILPVLLVTGIILYLISYIKKRL